MSKRLVVFVLYDVALQMQRHFPKLRGGRKPAPGVFIRCAAINARSSHAARRRVSRRPFTHNLKPETRNSKLETDFRRSRPWRAGLNVRGCNAAALENARTSTLQLETWNMELETNFKPNLPLRGTAKHDRVKTRMMRSPTPPATAPANARTPLLNLKLETRNLKLPSPPSDQSSDMAGASRISI